jgi:hypothetical protein
MVLPSNQVCQIQPNLPAVYIRHRPETTLLYQIVREGEIDGCLRSCKATNFSSWQDSHRTLRNPFSSRPHFKYSSNSLVTYAGKYSPGGAYSWCHDWPVQPGTRASTPERSDRAMSLWVHWFEIMNPTLVLIYRPQIWMR